MLSGILISPIFIYLNTIEITLKGPIFTGKSNVQIGKKIQDVEIQIHRIRQKNEDIVTWSSKNYKFTLVPSSENQPR